MARLVIYFNEEQGNLELIKQGFQNIFDYYQKNIADSLVRLTETALKGQMQLLLVTRTDEANRLFVDDHLGLLVALDGHPQLNGKRIGAQEVAQLYSQLGPEKMSDGLDGGWLLVIADGSKDKLMIIRDRIGLKPFYYYRKNKTFISASNLGALIKSGWIPSNVNQSMVGRYASCHYRSIYGRQESFFEKVSLLKPSQILEFNKNRITLTPYWDFDMEAPYIDSSAIDLEELYREKLFKAVGKSLEALDNQKVSIALSGGIDSGSIIGVIHQVIDQRIDAVSVTYREQTDFDESQLIQCSVRDHIEKWDNIELDGLCLLSDLPNLYKRFDIPLATISIYGYDYLYRQAARLGHKFIFTGSGGDYIQGGNYTNFFYALADYKNKHPDQYGYEVDCWIKNHSTSQYPKTKNTAEIYFKQFIDFNIGGQLLAGSTPLIDDILEPSFLNRVGDLSMEIVKPYGDYLRTFNVQEYYYDAVPPGIEAEDIIDWTYGTEVISPFFAKDVIEFGWLIPIEEKIRHGINKYLARRAMRNICSDEILDRVEKSGFNAPFDIWSRTILKELILDIFGSKRFKQRGIYNLNKFQVVLNQHMDEKENHMMFLWQALNLELWFNNWADHYSQSI